MKSRRALLIFNPAAAAGKNRDRRLSIFLEGARRLGWEVEVVRTGGAFHAETLAAGADRVEALLVAGGDGTVREVVSGRLKARTGFPDVGSVPIGILPMGTGNDVAMLLGVRRDEDLLEALDRGRHERLDVLRLETHDAAGRRQVHFGMLFAACGFAGDLLDCTTPSVKRVFGQHLAYPVGFLRALVRFRPFRMQVQSGGRSWEGEWVVALAANAPSAGGGTMPVAPGATMGDGRLDLCLIEATTRWELFWQFWRFLRGRHLGHPKVRLMQGVEMEVTSDEPVAVAVDGDNIGTTPVRIWIEPAALSFYHGASTR